MDLSKFAPSRLLLSRARRAMRAGDWQQGLQLYSVLVEREPRNARWLVQLGHAAKERGDLLAAERAYRRSIELDGQNADTHVQMGHLLKLAGDRDGALAAYRQAAHLDPNHSGARELRDLELATVSQGPQANRSVQTAPDAALQGVASQMVELTVRQNRLEQALGTAVAAVQAVGPRGAEADRSMASAAGIGWVASIRQDTVAGFLHGRAGSDGRFTLKVDALVELDTSVRDFARNVQGDDQLSQFAAVVPALRDGSQPVCRLELAVDGRVLDPGPIFVPSPALERQMAVLDLAGTGGYGIFSGPEFS